MVRAILSFVLFSVFVVVGRGEGEAPLGERVGVTWHDTANRATLMRVPTPPALGKKSSFLPLLLKDPSGTPVRSFGVRKESGELFHDQSENDQVALELRRVWHGEWSGELYFNLSAKLCYRGFPLLIEFSSATSGNRVYQNSIQDYLRPRFLNHARNVLSQPSQENIAFYSGSPTYFGVALNGHYLRNAEQELKAQNAIYRFLSGESGDELDRDQWGRLYFQGEPVGVYFFMKVDGQYRPLPAGIQDRFDFRVREQAKSLVSRLYNPAQYAERFLTEANNLWNRAATIAEKFSFVDPSARRRELEEARSLIQRAKALYARGPANATQKKALQDLDGWLSYIQQKIDALGVSAKPQ